LAQSKSKGGKGYYHVDKVGDHLTDGPMSEEEFEAAKEEINTKNKNDKEKLEKMKKKREKKAKEKALK